MEQQFQESTLLNVRKFGETMSKALKNVLGISNAIDEVTFNAELSVSQKMIVSILFTGTVYGEYMLAMDEEVAANFLGKTTRGIQDAELETLRGEMSSAFGEILNMAVGESIVGLNE